MAFNGYLIAEAYALLDIDTRKFDSKLAASGVKWDQFARKMNSAFGGTANSRIMAFSASMGRFNARIPAIIRNVDNLATSVRALTNATNAMGTAFSKAFNSSAYKAMQAQANLIKAQSVANLNNARAAAYPALTAAKIANQAAMNAQRIANLKAGGKVSRIGMFNSDAERARAIALKAEAQAQATMIRALNGPVKSLGDRMRDAVLSPFRSMRTWIDRGLAPFRGLKNMISGALAPLFSLRNIVLAGAFGFGAKEFLDNSADMELAFARIRRAAEFTDGEFVQFRKDLSTFGSYTSGIKMDDLFGLATIGAKMGIAGDALNLFTRDMAKVRIAIDVADLPTEELAERIGSLISVFHRGNDEAIRFASALNALDLKTVASARDILDVSGRMSGTASLLGMKPQEVLALSAALRQARVPIETAGTAMQQIMGRMASRKDSPQFARIAGMKEKPFLNLVGSDPLKAIIKIEEGLQRLDKITAIRALDQLGLDGQRVRGTLLQLGTVLPQLNDYVKVANSELTSLNSIMKSNEIIGETLHAQWMKVVNGFSLTADEVGKELLPIFKELASALESLMRDIRASLQANSGVLKEWSRWASERVAYVGVIWRNWGNVVELVSLKFRSAMEAMGFFGKRFSQGLVSNLMWLSKAGFTVLLNGIKAITPIALDLGMKLGLAIGEGIKNGFAGTGLTGWVGDKVKDLLGFGGGKPKAKANPMDGLFAGVDAAPGFDFQRPVGPGRNVGLGIAQREQMGILGGAVGRQRDERAKLVADANAEDAELRRRAEMMRVPVDSKPGERRRGADLSVLRPSGLEGVDFAANARRKAILDRNDNNPNIGVGGGTKPGALFGPGRNVLRAMDRARLAVPLRLRGGEFDPTSDFMGPRRAAVGLDMPRDLARRVGRAAGPTSLLGRQSRAGNAAYREWRNRVNAEFGRSGRRTDGAPAGGQLPPGTREKEKGVEDVLTEAKKQTDELREIKLALNDIKNKPNTI